MSITSSFYNWSVHGWMFSHYFWNTGLHCGSSRQSWCLEPTQRNRLKGFRLRSELGLTHSTFDAFSMSSDLTGTYVDYLCQGIQVPKMCHRRSSGLGVSCVYPNHVKRPPVLRVHKAGIARLSKVNHSKMAFPWLPGSAVDSEIRDWHQLAQVYCPTDNPVQFSWLVLIRAIRQGVFSLFLQRLFLDDFESIHCPWRRRWFQPWVHKIRPANPRTESGIATKDIVCWKA